MRKGNQSTSKDRTQVKCTSASQQHNPIKLNNSRRRRSPFPAHTNITENAERCSICAPFQLLHISRHLINNISFVRSLDAFNFIR